MSIAFFMKFICRELIFTCSIQKMSTLNFLWKKRFDGSDIVGNMTEEGFFGNMVFEKVTLFFFNSGTLYFDSRFDYFGNTRFGRTWANYSGHFLWYYFYLLLIFEIFLWFLHTRLFAFLAVLITFVYFL